MHPLLADPWIAAQVDAAIAPYLGRLPASEVAWMRDQLAETMSSDERTAKLARRARPTVVAKSGEVLRGATGEILDPGEQIPDSLPASVTPISAASAAKRKAAG